MNSMNDILTVIVGIIAVLIAFKLLKGLFKFVIILALVAGVAYFLFL